MIISILSIQQDYLNEDFKQIFFSKKNKNCNNDTPNATNQYQNLDNSMFLLFVFDLSNKGEKQTTIRIRSVLCHIQLHINDGLYRDTLDQNIYIYLYKYMHKQYTKTISHTN